MLNPWTFLLEIVNFLVLLWILKHFLYRPIVGIIDRRRDAVRRQMEELEAGQRALEEDRRRQEEALRGIEAERGRVLAQAREEAERERRRLLGEAKADIRQLQEREETALDEERRRALQEVEGRVIEAAVAVAEALLSGVAGQSLHNELVGRAARELAAIPHAEAARLVGSLPTPTLRVVSARQLSAEQQGLFTEAAAGLGLGGLPLEVEQDAGLSAGVRVELGELVLDATLASELAQVRGLAQKALQGGGR